MNRPWTIIAVEDVTKSAEWYTALLDAQDTHPRATVFDQVVDADGTVLLCLHHWGPSGPNGDHVWPSLANNRDEDAARGLLLWFVVDDFEAAWVRAQELGGKVEEPPNSDNGTGMRAFMLRDPDGYYVVVNEARAA